jgi:hypothetical protein
MDRETDVRTEVPLTAFDRDLLARLTGVTAEYSYADLHRLTGFHRETCRRYLTLGNPTVEFLSVLCETLGISIHWLLLGVGPCRRDDASSEWLATVKPADLLVEIGRRWRAQQADLTDLRARVARLEAASGIAAPGAHS